MKIFLALAFSFLAALPAHAQEVVFDMSATDTCLARGGDGMQSVCVGQSAERCMAINGVGRTTMGVSDCLRREWQAWDQRLNQRYQAVLLEARQNDADNAGLKYQAPNQEEALRAMQRAWIAFRDAKCDYVASLFQGGTGAGPGSLDCLMRETAAQTLYLRDVWK